MAGTLHHMPGVTPGRIVGDDHAWHTPIDEQTPRRFRFLSGCKLGDEDWFLISPRHSGPFRAASVAVLVIVGVFAGIGLIGIGLISFDLLADGLHVESQGLVDQVAEGGLR